MRTPGALAVAIVSVSAVLGVLGMLPEETTTCELLAPGFQRSTSRTTACLACHDGSVAEQISSHPPSHPTDRLYADALLAGRAALRPSPPPKLVLVEGRVVCATCHDGRSPYPHHVAVPASTLCQSCHDR